MLFLIQLYLILGLYYYNKFYERIFYSLDKNHQEDWRNSLKLSNITLLTISVIAWPLIVISFLITDGDEGGNEADDSGEDDLNNFD